MSVRYSMNVSGRSFTRFVDDDTTRLLVVAIALVLYLALAFHFFDATSQPYTFDSELKSIDLLKAKLFLLVSLAMALLIGASPLSRIRKIAGWLLVLSVYFIVLYALLYRGTEFGYGGQWGDNGNRLALVEKFCAYASPFQDWYFKDLPSFYPPLWFFLSGKLAALFGIESYQTIKYGYFVIYGLYPLGLFLAWRPLVGARSALAIVLVTIVIRDPYFDFVYYEYITAALFIPWWLSYVEMARRPSTPNLRWFLWGGLLGALLLMTFYYWFFIGIVTVLLRPVIRLASGKRLIFTSGSLSTKLLIAGGVALFALPYWGPLVLSVISSGCVSMQNRWFSYGYMTLPDPYFYSSILAALNLVGFVYLVARRKSRIAGTLLLFTAGILTLYGIERVLNLNELSIQTRKLTGLLPVFLAPATALGLMLGMRLVARRFRAGYAVAMAVVFIGLLHFGNLHTDIRDAKNYQWAINDYERTGETDIFRSVDCHGKVFLTDRYVEAVYLPYYLFVCPNGATAHPASQYDSRIAFLRFLGTLDSPAQVAWLLRSNRWNQVDFFYLPYDRAEQFAFYDIYPLYWPAQSVRLRLTFPFATTHHSPYFIRRHEAGLYAVEEPTESVREAFSESYDANDLESTTRAYNRLHLASEYLSAEQAAPLAPQLDTARADLERFVPLSSEPHDFAGQIELSGWSLRQRHAGDTVEIRLLYRNLKRQQQDYRVFIHAIAEDAAVLPRQWLSVGHINLDIGPTQRTASLPVGMYVPLTRIATLAPGRYRFLIGFHAEESGRLDKGYLTDWVTVEKLP